MKVIYKVPVYMFLIVLIFIAVDIYKDIKLATTTDLFEMIEYNTATKVGNPDATIFGVDAYLVLMMVGLFFAVVLSFLRRNLLEVKTGVAVIIAVTFFLQAYLGAKLLYGIETIINEKSLSAFSMEGQSLYGTIPITFLFILLLSKTLKKEYVKLLDFVAPLWLTLLVFVRLGCYVIGCCGADACSVFSISMILPVQLIEVAIDLIALQIIFNIENKHVNGLKTRVTEGTSFFVMMFMYGGYRFFLEFIRNNDVVLFGMTYGHIYSIICMILAIFCIDLVRKRSARHA